MKKQIEPARLSKYASWFFACLLQPHFETEEQYIFPLLGNDHALVKKALSHHQRLTQLFLSDEKSREDLHQLEEALQAHIRFEERVLFHEIQLVATEEELHQVQKYLAVDKFEDNLTDVFWED